MDSDTPLPLPTISPPAKTLSKSPSIAGCWKSYQASVASSSSEPSPVPPSTISPREPISPLSVDAPSSSSDYPTTLLVTSSELPTLQPGESTGPHPIQASPASLPPPARTPTPLQRPMPSPLRVPPAHSVGLSADSPSSADPPRVLGEDERTLYWNMGRCSGLSTNGTVRITLGRSTPLLLDLLRDQLLSSSRNQCLLHTL